MYYRKLGSTGYLAGEIGFTAWPNTGRPAPDDDVAMAMVRQALDRGVSFVEVSARDDGRIERVVGKAIAGRRENVLLAARVDVADSTDIEEQIRASVTRLGCEYLDLLELYQPDLEQLANRSVWGSIDRLRDAGLVRHCGVIAAGEAEANAAIASGQISVLHIALNAIDTDSELLLGGARVAGIGIIVRSPLLGGLLAAESPTAHALPPGDPRLDRPETSRRTATEVAERFGRIVADSGMTRAQAAIGWVLAHEEVGIVLPVASTMQQLTENLGASDLPLPSPRQLAAIQHARLTAVTV